MLFDVLNKEYSLHNTIKNIVYLHLYLYNPNKYCSIKTGKKQKIRFPELCVALRKQSRQQQCMNQSVCLANNAIPRFIKG